MTVPIRNTETNAIRKSLSTVIVLIFNLKFQEKDKISFTFPFVSEVARP